MVKRKRTPLDVLVRLKPNPRNAILATLLMKAGADPRRVAWPPTTPPEVVAVVCMENFASYRVRRCAKYGYSVLDLSKCDLLDIRPVMEHSSRLVRSPSLPSDAVGAVLDCPRDHVTSRWRCS